METILLVIVFGLLAALCVLVVMFRRPQPALPAPDFAPLIARLDSLERSLERTERSVREELARNRDEAMGNANRLRLELHTALETNSGALREQLAAIRQTTDEKLELVRRTVDEQLQGTLEKRLGESFRLVSERLEQVHKGLGEMQSLATGVGDLKRVFSDVRARGAWGEIQLGALLEQMLSPEQYARNVATAGTAERVEFAIKMPGAEAGGSVWLPIDAKFPQEDYLRLVDAMERGDAEAVESCSRQLEARLKTCARDINGKYVRPPFTTDFAIMYLPTESLYAEALRRPGLVESLQREFRVAVAGPTTLAALLNSLQMGFQTLAIQKQSSEVWKVLGQVRSEFVKYADVLARVQKKLQEASNTVDQGLTRTRVLERKLRDVESPALEPAEDQWLFASGE